MKHASPCAVLALASLPVLAPRPAAQETGEEPLTWENLEQRLAAETWLSGVVLVARDGEVLLSHSSGLANRAKGIPITERTVFAIGSTPIDFTRAAVLLLVQDDMIRLDEELPAFFDDVPADKRGITVLELMSDTSGLRDFHDLPTDRDPDHSWIDRDEAVRRILSQELLFAPGTGHQHSHSAWGLLAAMVEIRSDMSYPEFVRKCLFEPAGMSDTGFFGEPIDEQRLAIGYGVRSDGEVNAPPWWGHTSWLVMGSGGMVSTAPDLLAWNRALRAGRILSGDSLARYWSPPGSLLDGGDMYGFEIRYTEGPGTRFLLLSNAIDRSDRERFERLADELYRFVLADHAPPFTLGADLRVDDAGVFVARLAPGGPAEQAGLQAGDQLLAIDDEPLGVQPALALRRALERGAELTLAVQRGAERLRLVVTPRPR